MVLVNSLLIFLISLTVSPLVLARLVIALPPKKTIKIKPTMISSVGPILFKKLNIYDYISLYNLKFKNTRGNYETNCTIGAANQLDPFQYSKLLV